MTRGSLTALLCCALAFSVPAVSSAWKGGGQKGQCQGKKANPNKPKKAKVKMCKTTPHGKVKGKWVKEHKVAQFEKKGWTVAPRWFVDQDGDGYGDANDPGVARCKPPKWWVGVQNNQDCDDSDAGTHPGATEIPDGVDNTCDGTIDGGEGVPCPCFDVDDLAPISHIATCGGADFGDSFFNTVTSACSSAETGGVFEVGTNYCVMTITDCQTGDVLASSYLDGISLEESAACREAMEEHADDQGVVCDFFTEEIAP